MGIKKPESVKCEAICKSNKKACRSGGWMQFKGHHYCGMHFPYDDWREAGEPNYRKKE